MPVTVSVQIWVLFLYKKLNKLDLMVVFSHTVTRLYTVHYINAVTSPQPEVTLAYMVLGIQADCYCMIV